MSKLLNTQDEVIELNRLVQHVEQHYAAVFFGSENHKVLDLICFDGSVDDFVRQASILISWFSTPIKTVMVTVNDEIEDAIEFENAAQFKLIQTVEEYNRVYTVND